MALFEWTDNYSVKVHELDNQQKKIVGFIIEIHLAVREAHGKDVLGKILTELADYTVFHFSTEEKIMRDCNYPGYIIHKAEHDKLAALVKELLTNLKAGKSIPSQEVLLFLKDWLLSHIAVSDKKYSSFLNNKGIS